VFKTHQPSAEQAFEAARLRGSAARCGMFAENAASAADREFLLRMQRKWLARASHQDWLDDLPPTPPTNPNSLALRRGR
jgi:hypothetical protein